MSNSICIQTDRLLIRTIELTDKEDFFHYRSMPQVYKYQSWKPKQIGEVEEFIRRNAGVAPNTVNAWLQLAICLKEGRMIGDIGIHFIDDHQIEIGYTLSPDHQGKGYAIEAVKAVINSIFLEWNKHRITASVDPENTPSIILLEKLGFRKEAHFFKSFLMEDQWCDDVVYAMLEEEWTRSCIIE